MTLEDIPALNRAISRRTLLTAAGLGVAGAALAACGGGSGGTTAASSAAAGSLGSSAGGSFSAPPADTRATLSISNWGDPGDKPVYAAVADRFKKKYPNVTVEDNFTAITTWSDYINKLVTQIAGGKAPDVINIALEGFQLGVQKQLFRDLTSYLNGDKSAAALKTGVDPQLVAPFTKGGKQFLLPNTWNTMLVYYNTKMFAKAGIARPSDDWTWDEFQAIAKKLTTGSGSSKVYGFGLPYFNFGLTPWFYSNGTSELNADLTASNMTDPKMVESVTFVRDLVKSGISPAPKGADPYQLFPAGQVAMTGAGHWVVGPFKTAHFSDYDVVPWPKKTTKATVFGTGGFGIYAKSAQPDLAWEYLKELTSETTQQQWVTVGSATPTLKSQAQTTAFLAEPKHANLYYGAISYAKPVAAPPIYNTLETSVMRAMDSVMSGTDPAAALSAADKEINQAFQDQ